MKRFLLTLLLAITMACSPTKIHSRVEASLVRITSIVQAENMFGQHETVTSVCSGFLVQPHLVLTAGHCVDSDVVADGYPATTIKADKYYDLALLRVPQLNKPTLTLRSRPTWVGEDLIAVGYGFGWSKPLTLKIMVSVPAYSVGTQFPVGIITQGNLIHGMSGGPIVDSSGDVVTISQQTHEGMSYGVNTISMRAFLLDAGIEPNVVLGIN